jgi:EAL domain-containing protein (putative c-di-GMP-specific phosphodiesterase class I)
MAENSDRRRSTERFPQSATLFLAPPQTALPSLCAALERLAVECFEAFAGVLAVNFPADRLQMVGSALAESLPSAERGNTRCRIMPRGESPRAAELMQAQPLDDFLGWVEGQWFSQLLAEQRLVTYFQPIVRCGAPDKLFARECLTRGTEPEGRVVPPDRLFAAARATGQLIELDRAARWQAIETVARLKIHELVFINISPHSLLEPGECVEGALKAVLDHQLDPRQFVFEVIESDQITDGNQLLHILEHYREAGFRVALDDVGAGYSSLNLLAAVKPDFVKIDRALMHGIETDRYKAHVASKLLELSRELGVRTVMEGIETASQWQWSRNHGADYAQGFYFARPSPDPSWATKPNLSTVPCNLSPVP